MTSFMKSLIAFVLLAFGCASVPLAPPQEDEKSKELRVPHGNGVVYLYRNETYGGLSRMTVLMDGDYVGETASKTYMVWVLHPGRHVLVSKGEDDSRLDFVVEPGRKYYVWQEAKLGLTGARSKLSMVSEGEGQAALTECKLVQTDNGRPH